MCIKSVSLWGWRRSPKLENLRQSLALAYFDCFWLFAVAMLAVTLVVFLMKRSVAEKGARIGGE